MICDEFDDLTFTVLIKTPSTGADVTVLSIIIFKCNVGGLSELCHKCVMNTRGCIQKFLDWLPGARTANGTALGH
jgi:hypothetical protein